MTFNDTPVYSIRAYEHLVRQSGVTSRYPTFQAPPLAYDVPPPTSILSSEQPEAARRASLELEESWYTVPLTPGNILPPPYDSVKLPDYASQIELGPRTIPLAHQEYDVEADSRGYVHCVKLFWKMGPFAWPVGICMSVPQFHSSTHADDSAKTPLPMTSMERDPELARFEEEVANPSVREVSRLLRFEA